MSRSWDLFMCDDCFGQAAQQAACERTFSVRETESIEDGNRGIMAEIEAEARAYRAARQAESEFYRPAIEDVQVRAVRVPAPSRQMPVKQSAPVKAVAPARPAPVAVAAPHQPSARYLAVQERRAQMLAVQGVLERTGLLGHIGAPEVMQSPELQQLIAELAEMWEQSGASGCIPNAGARVAQMRAIAAAGAQSRLRPPITPMALPAHAPAANFVDVLEPVRERSVR